MPDGRAALIERVRGRAMTAAGVHSFVDAIKKAVPNWDPAKHPRDRVGQFLEVGDIVKAYSGPTAVVPDAVGKVSASYYDVPTNRMFIGLDVGGGQLKWYRPKQLENIKAKATLTPKNPKIPLPALDSKQDEVQWDSYSNPAVPELLAQAETHPDSVDPLPPVKSLTPADMVKVGLGEGAPAGSVVPQKVGAAPLPPGKTPEDMLALVSTSFINKGLHENYPGGLTQWNADFDSMLADTDFNSASQKLSKLMTAAKLGGKQRKRYVSFLEQHHGGSTKAMKVVGTPHLDDGADPGVSIAEPSVAKIEAPGDKPSFEFWSSILQSQLDSSPSSYGGKTGFDVDWADAKLAWENDVHPHDYAEANFAADPTPSEPDTGGPLASWETELLDAAPESLSNENGSTAGVHKQSDGTWSVSAFYNDGGSDQVPGFNTKAEALEEAQGLIDADFAMYDQAKPGTIDPDSGAIITDVPKSDPGMTANYHSYIMSTGNVDNVIDTYKSGAMQSMDAASAKQAMLDIYLFQPDGGGVDASHLAEVGINPSVGPGAGADGSFPADGFDPAISGDPFLDAKNWADAVTEYSVPDYETWTEQFGDLEDDNAFTAMAGLVNDVVEVAQLNPGSPAEAAAHKFLMDLYAGSEGELVSLKNLDDAGVPGFDGMDGFDDVGGEPAPYVEGADPHVDAAHQALSIDISDDQVAMNQYDAVIDLINDESVTPTTLAHYVKDLLTDYAKPAAYKALLDVYVDGNVSEQMLVDAGVPGWPKVAPVEPDQALLSLFMNDIADGNVQYVKNIASSDAGTYPPEKIAAAKLALVPNEIASWKSIWTNADGSIDQSALAMSKEHLDLGQFGLDSDKANLKAAIEDTEYALANAPEPDPDPPKWPGPAALGPHDHVYVHPQGSVIVVNDFVGSVTKFKPDGKKASTSATAENLAAGHGAWQHIGTGPDAIGAWDKVQASNASVAAKVAKKVAATGITKKTVAPHSIKKVAAKKPAYAASVQYYGDLIEAANLHGYEVETLSQATIDTGYQQGVAPLDLLKQYAAPATGVETPPVGLSNHPDQYKTLKLLVTSMTNKGKWDSETVGWWNTMNATETSYPDAAVLLGKLMTRANLGGKQRKRYKDALAAAFGVEVGSSSKPSMKSAPPGKPLGAQVIKPAAASSVSDPPYVVGPGKGNKLVNPGGGFTPQAAKRTIQDEISSRMEGKVTRDQLVKAVLDSDYQWSSDVQDLARAVKSGKVPPQYKSVERATYGTWVLSTKHPSGHPDSSRPITQKDLEFALRSTAANSMIKLWAQTSNDSNVLSLAMQDAAVEEFGLKDTYGWTKGNVSKAAVQKELDLQRELLRTFLRAMYENTQEWAKKNKVTHVRLVRGSGTYAGPVGSTAKVKLRPMSSFSTNKTTANSFGANRIAAIVPIEWIVGTAATGFGCQSEYEYVVLGGIHEVKVVG